MHAVDVGNEKESHLYVYRKAEVKAKLIGEVNRVLKEIGGLFIK